MFHEHILKRYYDATTGAFRALSERSVLSLRASGAGAALYFYNSRTNSNTATNLLAKLTDTSARRAVDIAVEVFAVGAGECTRETSERFHGDRNANR